MRTSRAIVAGLFVVAGLAGPCQAMQEESPLRRIEVSQEVALAGMTTDFEIFDFGGGRVFGRFWATSGDVNRGTLERRFGCSAFRDGRNQQSWRCVPGGLRVDWNAVLSALDRAGIMDPPLDDTPRDMICMDGAPWHVVVRRRSAADSVITHQACSPRGPARISFEHHMDSIITRVLEDVEHSAHTDNAFHDYGVEPITGLHLGLPGAISATLGLRIGLGDWLPGDVFVATEPGLLVRRSSAGYMLYESQYTGAGIVFRAAQLKAWSPAPFARRDVTYHGGELSLLWVYTMGGRIGVYRGSESNGPKHWLVTADIGIGF